MGSKFIEKIFGRKRENFKELTEFREMSFTEASKIREELKLERDATRKENDDLKVEVDRWKEKYWKQVKQNASHLQHDEPDNNKENLND